MASLLGALVGLPIEFAIEPDGRVLPSWSGVRDSAA